MVSVEGRQGQPGAFLREGAFRLGLCQPRDRILNPMIRETIDQPWREVSWDEAISFAADRLRGLQERYGRKSIGVITSSRCTNEETYLVQKLARAVFHEQQYRHLRAGLPFAHGLRAWPDLRHLGRNAGLRLRHAVGRGRRDRREPDRRAPGLRLAAEEAAAAGREADRDRPAPDRPRADRRMSRRRITWRSVPAPMSRSSPRWPMSS